MSSHMKLVDSHAHLEEIEDLDLVINRARENGVIITITVGSDYESNNQALEIAEKYHPWVYPALGAHPSDTEAALASLDRNLQFIEDHLGKTVAKGMLKLNISLGFPTTLREAGATEAHLTRMLEAAKNPQLRMKLLNMPVPLDPAKGDVDTYMRGVLEAAFTGDLDKIRLPDRR